MSGVTILATSTVLLGIPWYIILIIGIGFWLISTFILSIVLEDVVYNEWKIIVGTTIGTLVFCLFLAFASGETKEQTQYKVILDDTVNYKEFTEKYEVIDQEGQIYTIIERE